MVQSKVGNALVVHGATLSSNPQSHVADPHHASCGKRDSSRVNGSWWYELYVHSPPGILSVRDSFEGHHAESPLTPPDAGWHPPDAVPPRGEVDPLLPSETLYRKSFKLTQALPTDGANYRDTIWNDPKRYWVRTWKGPNNIICRAWVLRTRLTFLELKGSPSRILEAQGRLNDRFLLVIDLALFLYVFFLLSSYVLFFFSSVSTSLFFVFFFRFIYPPLCSIHTAHV